MFFRIKAKYSALTSMPAAPTESDRHHALVPEAESGNLLLP